MFQRKCRLHSDWWSGCLDCGWNISVGNKQIYIGTWQADRPRSRLHDGIVTCLVASKTMELFKISECRHWAPKFDIWALKFDSSFSPSFLNCFFCFFDCSGMGVGLQKLAFLSHTEMDINHWILSASWRFSCDTWLSAMAFISCIRIVILVR